MRRAALHAASGLLLLAGACKPAAEPGAAAPAGPAPVAATAPAQTAPVLYGAPLDADTPRLALAELMKSPETHAGKTIRTEGEIRRVCQRMGCWMELAQPGSASALRVPMAGHAFFLPKSVQGKRAEVQGTIQIAELSAAHKEHLESEGAQATGSDVSLSATGVSVQ
jgi:hypothetical protein